MIEILTKSKIKELKKESLDNSFKESLAREDSICGFVHYYCKEFLPYDLSSISYKAIENATFHHYSDWEKQFKERFNSYFKYESLINDRYIYHECFERVEKKFLKSLRKLGFYTLKNHQIGYGFPYTIYPYFSDFLVDLFEKYFILLTILICCCIAFPFVYTFMNMF